MRWRHVVAGFVQACAVYNLVLSRLESRIWESDARVLTGLLLCLFGLVVLRTRERDEMEEES